MERGNRTERLAVGAIIVKNRAILVLRRKSSDFMPGIDDLPGGGVEQGESVEQALIREVREETGLNVLSVGKPVSCFEYVSESGKRTVQHNHFVEVAMPAEITLSEHDSYAWIAEDALDKCKASDETKKAMKQAFVMLKN